jgi:hypothetical protein
MFEQSIIRRSGQWWKAVAAYAAVSGGGVMMLFALAHLVRAGDGSQFALLLFGILVGAAGFLAACLAIRCPDCGAHWVWLAVSKQSSNRWLVWLHDQQACPICNHGLGRRVA